MQNLSQYNLQARPNLDAEQVCTIAEFISSVRKVMLKQVAHSPSNVSRAGRTLRTVFFSHQKRRESDWEDGEP